MPKRTVAPEPIIISSIDDAIAALEEMEEIGERIAEDMKRQVELKKAATAFAVKKKIDVLQLDGAYFRQINRASRFWIGEPAEMPSPTPKGAKSLREICAGLTATVKGKEIPLWNYITKRVPDPEKIDKAVALGFVKESVISKAYIEKPQAPFLQRYSGEASDG
jgi:hypothetical protein